MTNLNGFNKYTQLCGNFILPLQKIIHLSPESIQNQSLSNIRRQILNNRQRIQCSKNQLETLKQICFSALSITSFRSYITKHINLQEFLHFLTKTSCIIVLDSKDLKWILHDIIWVFQKGKTRSSRTQTQLSNQPERRHSTKYEKINSKKQAIQQSPDSQSDQVPNSAPQNLISDQQDTNQNQKYTDRFLIPTVNFLKNFGNLPNQSLLTLINSRFSITEAIDKYNQQQQRLINETPKEDWEDIEEADNDIMEKNLQVQQHIQQGGLRYNPFEYIDLPALSPHDEKFVRQHLLFLIKQRPPPPTTEQFDPEKSELYLQNARLFTVNLASYMTYSVTKAIFKELGIGNKLQDYLTYNRIYERAIRNSDLILKPLDYFRHFLARLVIRIFMSILTKDVLILNEQQAKLTEIAIAMFQHEAQYPYTNSGFSTFLKSIQDRVFGPNMPFNRKLYKLLFYVTNILGLWDHIPGILRDSFNISAEYQHELIKQDDNLLTIQTRGISLKEEEAKENQRKLEEQEQISSFQIDGIEFL